MKHPSIRLLFEYWNKPRGGGLPNHMDIEPNAIRGILADTFMLSLPRCRPGRFCAAGTRVCALMGRELKGTAFLDLWSSGSRGHVAELLAIVSQESVGVVASASARDLAKAEVTHAAMTLEMLLLPLADDGRTDARLLGALLELIDAIPADQEIRIYKQGDWFDLCRGPHMKSTGQVGGAFHRARGAPPGGWDRYRVHAPAASRFC